MSEDRTRIEGDGTASGQQPGTEHESELDRLRREIGEVDRALMSLVAKRVELARRIGEAKREAGIATLDAAREAAVVRQAGELAREAGLDAEEVRPLFWHLIGLSRRAQLEGEESEEGTEERTP